jgi:dTDP-4-dehydrorhamnose 3,5-epimerase
VKFHKKSLNLEGCYELVPNIMEDDRGMFVKTFHDEAFKRNGFETDFKEDYYSWSIKGVLRGLHFQIPPKEHTKLVYCPVGRIMDVIVDLRKGSPTFGQYTSLYLSSQEANMVYIPAGMAHGFYVESDKALVVYKVTSVYSPIEDKGIHWNSLGIPWPNEEPIVSERDHNFIDFSGFDSPFIFEKKGV